MIKEKIIISQDELKQLHEITDSYHSKVYEIGQLYTEQFFLKERLGEITEKLEKIGTEYASIQQNEIRLAKILREKYGDGTIDPETGEFARTGETN